MSSPPAASPLRVFLVEDAPAIRARVAALLESIPGVTLIGSADSVASAIAGLEATSPDAVVLDLQILGGSGLDVLRAVRPKLPGLRVIVLTNFATDQHRRACLAAGAEHFLDKTAEFPRLREILEQWATTAAAASAAAPAPTGAPTPRG
jgi:DNA-binding NarL/FixJ family response regulator